MFGQSYKLYMKLDFQKWIRAKISGSVKEKFKYSVKSKFLTAVTSRSMELWLSFRVVRSDHNIVDESIVSIFKVS
jgi:hypothetical protein